MGPVLTSNARAPLPPKDMLVAQKIPRTPSHPSQQPWLSIISTGGSWRQSGLQNNNNHLSGLITQIFHTRDSLY